jgi:kynurenine formamidase
MKLPSRMLDISVALDNETVLDPPFMRPKIDYKTGKENAWTLLDAFPGLKSEDLPDGEAWAVEFVHLATHNGTHMDAPYHYQSKSIDGERMITIDEVPLDWFFRPGVKLDFRGLPDGHIVTAAEVEAERAYQHARRRSHRQGRLFIGRLRHGPRINALSYVARCARLRHRRLGLGRALRAHAQALGSDARSLDHLGRPQSRPGDSLLPHGEAVQPRSVAGRWLHCRLLPGQDQSRVRRLDARRGAVRLKG